MFEFTEEHLMVQKALRDWLTANLEPKVAAFEHGEESPFPLMRSLAQTFGIDEMVRSAFVERQKRKAEGGDKGGSKEASSMLGDPYLSAVLMKEISRFSPSFALSFGASAGLCGGTIMTRGTDQQRERYGLPLMTFEKVGAWAVTEPSAGSDAFSLTTTAVPDGDEYVLNGSKTFITNAPAADIMVVYANIDRGQGKRRDKRFVFPFVFERGHKGLSLGKPMKKMGMRGSPTGEIFLEDVRATKENLLGGEETSGRDQVKDVFAGEREGVGPMALGIIERCLEISTRYATERCQFGKPIGKFQMIQEKLARMYVAYENVLNHVFHQAWANKNRKQTWRSVCATKAYCADIATEVGMQAIQILGGYGYCEEYIVEMLARDAKLLMIGGGTTDIQLLNVARDLLRAEGLEVQIFET